MGRLKALDLFCGAGGASMGLHRAGYEVVGVDIKPQPNYPFQFVCDDALEILEQGVEWYDLIWASPPCQAYSMATAGHRNAGASYPDLLPAVREHLEATQALWIIENVPGAPMRCDVVLCGTNFGLPLIRHRWFELSARPQLSLMPCQHTGNEVPVYGNGTPSWHLQRRQGKGFTVAEQRDAMGIDWMTRNELKEAIPPAYSEFLARQIGG